MKKFTINQFISFLMIFSLFLLSGCFFILAVNQPSTAGTSETITVTVDVKLNETDYGVGGGPSAAITAMLIPIDWTVESVSFDGDYGPEDMVYLHTDSIDVQPAAGTDFWYDSLATFYPADAGMHWVVYQGSETYPSTGDTASQVTFTYEFKTGAAGTFELGYMVSTADLGFQEAHYRDVSLGHSISVVEKLLISEIVAQPTDGEFVEIYNPGRETVDLSNYYLANSTYQGGGTYYYQVVEGGGGGGSFADFNAQFPDGAMIQSGEYQTIAMAGDSLFFSIYGLLPTYELYEDSTNAKDVPDMREAVPGSIAGQGGFSNGDEDAILYFWDGLSDLVVDVDYVIYDEGDMGINEQVDKTGVSIDGPDVDSVATMYLADTPIGDQVPAPINSLSDGFSTHRIDFYEGNQTPTGGNGVTGADETSEDLNNTFTANSVPSPNGPWVTPPSLPDITNLGAFFFKGSNDAEPWPGAGSPNGEKLHFLFDDTSSTKYLVGAEVSWIDVYTGRLSNVTEYTITSANDSPERDPKDWEFQGWNVNTSAWVTLHTVADNPMWPDLFTPKTWTFENTAWYSSYRLNITAINGDNLMQISEFEINGELGDTVDVVTPDGLIEDITNLDVFSFRGSNDERPWPGDGSPPG
ncbi:MAG: lamin tail domain-containing protein, partial [Gammaproteobacteria bacterium]|nr:lamin tail domain-containing protein [Gammaproteobacteria bacterium]